MSSLAAKSAKSAKSAKKEVEAPVVPIIFLQSILEELLRKNKKDLVKLARNEYSLKTSRKNMNKLIMEILIAATSKVFRIRDIEYSKEANKDGEIVIKRKISYTEMKIDQLSTAYTLKSDQVKNVLEMSKGALLKYAQENDLQYKSVKDTLNQLRFQAIMKSATLLRA